MDIKRAVLSDRDEIADVYRQAVTLNRFTPENAYGSIACVSALDDPRLW